MIWWLYTMINNKRLLIEWARMHRAGLSPQLCIRMADRFLVFEKPDKPTERFLEPEQNCIEPDAEGS